MFGRIRRWLSARHAPLVIILGGLALVSPALGGDFVADDHLHRILSRDDPGIDGLSSRPFDLFVFASGDPAANHALMDAGVFPWWTAPEARLAFLRPLSSATHAFDHALWPDSATAMLVHNLVWYALALLVVWRFYRRFAGASWVAALALLLYAVDDARGPPVSWIANRNAIIAVVLALPVLLVYDRWRREGWTPGRWLAPLLLVPALLAGESAVGVGAYLAAHALHLDRGRWRERALALAPFAVVVIVWRVAYVGLGYGVTGSGIYIDAGADPAAFAGAVGTRLPLLLLGQLALPWSDLSVVYPLLGSGVRPMVVAGALAFLALFALAVWPLVRRDAHSRFFATGMVLAALPVCSTFAADRLLWFVGLGGAGLVAALLGAAAHERSALGASRRRRGLALTVAALLALINVVLAPAMLVSRSRSMIAMDQLISRGTDSIPRDASVVDKTVVLVSSPADPFGGYTPLMRASKGEPRPAHLRWLSTGRSPVTVERPDMRSLRVRPDDGFVAHEMDYMLHDPARRFAVGDRVPLTGLVIEIESVTGDGRPLVIRAVFDRVLEDPGLVFLRWGSAGFVPYSPPAPGQAHRLPAVDYHALLTGEVPDQVPQVEALPAPH